MTSGSYRYCEAARAARAATHLFAARMTPELSVSQGGRPVNAHGDQGESATFGKPTPWADYSGVRNGVREGLAVFNHPQNRWSPPPWFTLDYGFFSPTP